MFTPSIAHVPTYSNGNSDAIAWFLGIPYKRIPDNGYIIPRRFEKLDVDTPENRRYC